MASCIGQKTVGTVAVASSFGKTEEYCPMGRTSVRCFSLLSGRRPASSPTLNAGIGSGFRHSSPYFGSECVVDVMNGGLHPTVRLERTEVLAMPLDGSSASSAVGRMTCGGDQVLCLSSVIPLFSSIRLRSVCGPSSSSSSSSSSASASPGGVETADAAVVEEVGDPSVMAMVQSTIAEKISEDVSKVGADMALSDLGIDSLDQVEIMMAFEEKCGVSVEDGGSEGGAESMKTVKDVAILLQKLIAKQKSSEDS